MRIKSLDEMLEEIRFEYIEGSAFNSTTAYSRAYCETGFLSKRHYEMFEEYRAAHALDISIRECILNAAEHGNKLEKEKWVSLQIYIGSKGIVAEVEDEGNGIPEHIAKFFEREEYNDELLVYDGEGFRGCGFHGIRMRIKRKELVAIGFNEKRNTIYLMALFQRLQT